jgi:hypothetical protein
MRAAHTISGRALAAACLALLVCGGCGGGHQGTELLVSVEFDLALGIDQLLVLGQAGDPPWLTLEPGLIPASPGGPLPSGSTVALALPDMPDTSAFTLVVDGHAGGARVATGTASNLTVPPLTLTALSIPLFALACGTPLCIVGERSCASATESRICLENARGCGIWSTPLACPDGGTCHGGACSAGCGPDSHSCGELCVSNIDTATCGASCSPCPTAPNAVPVCDGTRCLLACLAGYQLCRGSCVPVGDPSCG